LTVTLLSSLLELGYQVEQLGVRSRVTLQVDGATFVELADQFRRFGNTPELFRTSSMAWWNVQLGMLDVTADYEPNRAPDAPIDLPAGAERLWPESPDA
jgi:hypothetical protein